MFICNWKSFLFVTFQICLLCQFVLPQATNEELGPQQAANEEAGTGLLGQPGGPFGVSPFGSGLIGQPPTNEETGFGPMGQVGQQLGPGLMGPGNINQNFMGLFGAGRAGQQTGNEAEAESGPMSQAGGMFGFNPFQTGFGQPGAMNLNTNFMGKPLGPGLMGPGNMNPNFMGLFGAGRAGQQTGNEAEAESGPMSQAGGMFGFNPFQTGIGQPGAINSNTNFMGQPGSNTGFMPSSIRNMGTYPSLLTGVPNANMLVFYRILNNEFVPGNVMMSNIFCMQCVTEQNFICAKLYCGSAE